MYSSTSEQAMDVTSPGQTSLPRGPDLASEIELSIVMPCLNEAETVGACVGKAVAWLGSNGVKGEVIVADNGSTDGSQQVARAAGARIVDIASRGYGSALMGGIAASRGRFIIMGDADDSYDFADLGSFVTQLRAGADLVQGCRLPAGGGQVMPGAMPKLHLWWGNPMFSAMGRLWFKAPIHDIYCGLRGFTSECYERLGVRSMGMAFATEMIIKASLFGEKVTEVPITLYRDGRKSRRPHLKTFRDGWRTLHLFLMYSPRWLFVLPGSLLIVIGLLAYALALPGISLFGARLDAHTLLFGSLAILCGFNSIWFAIMTKLFAATEGMLPDDPMLSRLIKLISTEKGLLVAFVGILCGIALLLVAVNQWRLAGFGMLDYAAEMRLVIPGATLTALSFQMILSIFFIDILKLHRKR
jgi:glycosyltransferase involved in cell wall biosynthesis